MTPDTTTVSAETRPLCLPRHDPCVRNPKMTISLEACLKNGVRHNTCVRRDTTPVSDETRPLCPTRQTNYILLLLILAEHSASVIIVVLCVLHRYRLYIHVYQYYIYNDYIHHQIFEYKMDYHMILYNALTRNMV